MKKHIFLTSFLIVISLALVTATGQTRGLGGKGDVFKGKLFPPKMIMQNRDELDMTKKQFTTMRGIILEVQTGVAEHEWDMQEAYKRVLAELDQSPIDEAQVLENIRAVLTAENNVKLSQVTMLIRLRNLLTAEQVEILRQKTGN